MPIHYSEQVRMLPKYFLIVIGLIGGLCIWSIIQDPQVQYFVLLGVTVIFALLCSAMIITVDEEKIRVRSELLPCLRKDIPLKAIASTEAVTYRPIREFGGWGIRCGKFRGERTAVLSMKGNQGLLLVLSEETKFLFGKTKRIIIGTVQPEQMKAAIVQST